MGVLLILHQSLDAQQELFSVGHWSVGWWSLGHQFIVDESGETVRFYTSSTSNVSKLCDEELDSPTRQIIGRFPNFCRWMIDGHFKHLGH